MFFFKSMRGQTDCPDDRDPSHLIQNDAPSASKFMRRARALTNSKAGNVSIIFGLMAVPFVSFAGLSIDFAAAAREKSKIQTALDSAVLAAGRAFQVSGSEGEAKAAAELYFTSQTGYSLSINTIDPGTFVLTVGADEQVNTSFMAVMGDKFDALGVSARAKAQLVREIQGDKVEVAMMLDVTGSMGWTVTGGTGSRMDELKIAAIDLVNILVKHNDDNVRIALAPFARAVNVAGKYKKWTGLDPVSDDRRCVVERFGANRFTNAKPSNANGKFQPYPNSSGCTTAKIYPLSSNKNQLVSRINSLPTDGGTAGHLGTAWAWYLLSKTWHNQWSNARRKPSNTNVGVKKIAVLMTDGDYNTRWNSSDTNKNSDQQAKEICDAMKADGIQVYSVGFELTENSSPYNRLEDCASSDVHFFPAATGEELKAAFRSIAFNIAELRLVE